MKLVLLSALVTLCVVVAVSADDYGEHGYGHQTYIIAGGGGGKQRRKNRGFQLKVKGKGMQQMQHQMPHHYHKEEHYEQPKEILYYPVPIYTPMHEEHHDYHDHHDYHKDDDHKVNIIPISMGGGYGHMGGGYGHMMGGGYGHMMGGGGYGGLASLLGR